MALLSGLMEKNGLEFNSATLCLPSFSVLLLLLALGLGVGMVIIAGSDIEGVSWENL